MYDYWLGGRDNFEADREEAERQLQINPDLRRLAQENRMFLGRGVRWLAADCGIRQFLDVGSGLPTANNTHDVAQWRRQLNFLLDGYRGGSIGGRSLTGPTGRYWPPCAAAAWVAGITR